MNLLLIHAAFTWFMAGIIWFVQIIHYPLFSGIGENKFIEYQNSHVRRTGYVVGPAMLAELVSAIALTVHNVPNSTIGLILLSFIWIATFALSVPCHNQLSRGFNSAVHRRLVLTNWIRTILWSLRAFLSLYMISMFSK